MPTVRLTETHIRGLYLGSNGCMYARTDGVERPCSRCGRWSQIVYRWADQHLCGRHVRVLLKDRIRVLTTFACRAFEAGESGLPPARVLRRGDSLAVTGRPERVGRFDKFALPCGGFVLVPRSRWAWA